MDWNVTTATRNWKQLKSILFVIVKFKVICVWVCFKRQALSQSLEFSLSMKYSIIHTGLWNNDIMYFYLIILNFIYTPHYALCLCSVILKEHKQGIHKVDKFVIFYTHGKMCAMFYDDWLSSSITNNFIFTPASAYNSWPAHSSAYNTWPAHSSAYDSWPAHSSAYDSWPAYSTAYDSWPAHSFAKRYPYVYPRQYFGTVSWYILQLSSLFQYGQCNDIQNLEIRYRIILGMRFMFACISAISFVRVT